MEKNNRSGNSKEIFATIRNLNGDFKSKLSVLKDENSNILTEEKEIQQRWKQYTQKLYSRDPYLTDHC